MRVGRQTGIILNIKIEIKLGQLCKEDGVSERRRRDDGTPGESLPVTRSSSTEAACADASVEAPEDAIKEFKRFDDR